MSEIELVHALSLLMKIFNHLAPDKRNDLGVVEQVYQMGNLRGVDVDDILAYKLIHQFTLFEFLELAKSQIEVTNKFDAGHELVIGVVFDI